MLTKMKNASRKKKKNIPEKKLTGVSESAGLLVLGR